MSRKRADLPLEGQLCRWQVPPGDDEQDDLGRHLAAAASLKGAPFSRGEDRIEPLADLAPTPFEAVPETRTTDVRLARVLVRSRKVGIGRRGGGRLTVRCRAERGDRCKLGGSLRRGSVRIASVAGSVRGARRATVGVRLTKRGLRRLRRAGSLRVRVIVTSSSLSGRGAPVRGEVRLVLRR